MKNRADAFLGMNPQATAKDALLRGLKFVGVLKSPSGDAFGCSPAIYRRDRTASPSATAAALLAAALLLTACGAPAPEGEAAADSGAKAPAIDPAIAEQLAHHRNLGKAFYENSATQYEAIDELKKAWDLAPDSVCEHANYALGLMRAGQEEEGVKELEVAQQKDGSLPHTWFNLGIAYKRASEYDKALVQFERMIELVPDDAIAHFNLASLYKLEGRRDEALTHFEKSAELDPNLGGPHFQLSTLYRQMNRKDDAKAATKRFRELKAIDDGAAVQEDLEWSFYSELCEFIDPAHSVDDAAPVDVVFEVAEVAPNASVLATDVAAGAVDKSLGDADNDGFHDLAVLEAAGPALYYQRDGKYVRDSSAGWPSGSYNAVIWHDWDHDYDLDLVLLGKDSKVINNDGMLPTSDAPDWSDVTDRFPFTGDEHIAGAVFDLIPDTQGMGLAVLNAGGGGTFYRDWLAGKHEAQPLPGVPAGAKTIIAFDADSDSRTDLVVGGDSGVTILRNVGPLAGFSEFVPTQISSEPVSALAFADLENRGLSDLVTSAGVLRNGGDMSFTPSPIESLPATTALDARDLDEDGRIDLAAVTVDGNVVALHNRTEGGGNWLKMGVTGSKNMLLAPRAEIEVKAGLRYQKKSYHGTPLHFGLGAYEQVDTIRITWPNGLIQNESQKPAGESHHFPEAQRLSGSCPMIYTWNGEEFEFITDVLGVAPLGASAGDGETFPVDHNEHIQIAAESLVEKDGKYEIRIVEELREVAYIDEIKLIAVDRPEDVDIFINDKFQGPPFPDELVLYGASERLHPVSAEDHLGNDVRDLVLAKDKTYPDAYERDMAGRAEMHTLTLDFGDVAESNDAVMVMAGWVDWADGSTFLAASQNAGNELVTPYLEVLDENGEWQTVLPDMGMPAGKPKTIVVDLRGLFLSGERKVRITTNVCVYWDEIFLAENAEALVADAVRTDVYAETADLLFTGFSRNITHPQRTQPEQFIYAERSATSMWNPTRGMYTRFGDVKPLLAEVDDQFLIMGSGDEIRLFFDAAALPALPDGWRRDFVLKVDGWAKDGDANTIHSQTVGPLPFHGMPAYPYAEPDAYPDTPEHREYQETYNTRPALRLIRPLNEGISP